MINNNQSLVLYILTKSFTNNYCKLKWNYPYYLLKKQIMFLQLLPGGLTNVA